MHTRSYSLLVALSLTACRKHVPVDHVVELAAPSCAVGAPPAHTLNAIVALVPASRSPDLPLRETYAFEAANCLVNGTARLEYPQAATIDVAVVYDAQLSPLQVWKRSTLPGRADGPADVRRYELRTPDVSIAHRTPDGHVTYELLRPTPRRSNPARPGPPRAVISPSHGLLTAWLRRAHLGVGQQVSEMVLDVREAIEVFGPATLKREPDQFVATLGRTVRVYMLYGWEPIFADETDTVVGDLAGQIVSSDLASAPPMFQRTLHD